MKGFLDISCQEFNPRFEGNWKLWEDLAKELPEKIETRNLRDTVDQLPFVKVEDLNKDLNLIKRAYVMFTFIAHGYVRGRLDQEVITILPAKISVIWIELGELLGVPPVATYAATVLFNLKPQSVANEQEREPEDFEIEFTFTGTEDEKWFYAISAAIDVRSSSIIKIIDSVLTQENYDDDNDWFAEKLENEIKIITRILQRMYERCRPEIFYNKIRMYLSGWLNDREIGPDGLIYQLTTSNTKENADTSAKFVQFKLAGGSAAQNPTIQLLDVILGVKHGNNPDNLMIAEFKCCDYGSGGGGCPSRPQHHEHVNVNYLNAMRTYMPKEHRDYLNELGEKLQSNFYFNEKFKKTDGYKKCVKALIEFRSEHIKMVTHYIICQKKVEERVQGTGGSNPVPFLKKCRRETEFCLFE